MTAVRDAGGLHDPVATDTPVIAYFEPQALPFHTAPGSAPRESAFGATEPCLLRLCNTGIDGAQLGPHLALYSLRQPGTALFTFHTSCLGPMVPFHAYDFSVQNGMRPTPDTAYIMVHGNHLRRGLTIRFPTGMGESLMPLCNDFLASPAPLSNFRKPATLDLLTLNATPLGFAFYARSSNRLPKGEGYFDDPPTRSAGQRAIVTLSRPSASSSSTAFVSIRPDNTATSEERFPLNDATFSVVRSPTGSLPLRKGGGRTPGARMHSRGRALPPVIPSKEMVQIEIKCASSSRRILLDLFPSPDTRQPLTPTGVRLACQQFLLSAQGSEVMAPPAPTPPPGRGAGDTAAAQNATTVANVGANPADVARARSVLAMVTQPPPPALGPVAASQAAAISQLKTASTRRDKPHLVILADSAVPADWGEMIQRQAPDLCVTAVSVSGDSLSRLAGAYLSARETHPMPIQELALVVPIGILRTIASMPTASRLDVATRDAAVRSLTTELLHTVHLLVSQPLVRGTGGAEATPTPRRVSLYVWRADTRQSDLGAASVAVFTSLKKEFPDGSPVRVCTQLDNVTLNQAQQAIAADWDSKLSSMYLHTTEGVEQWTDAALAFFATVVGGSAVHNWRAALRADADASVMKVVGAAVPATSANVENLRRAVHGTNLCKPPRAGWNEPFVMPESVELFAAIVERSWAWTSTSAGVFREKTMVQSSPDFVQLAAVLARTPDPSASRATGVQPPAAADFGLDAHAAVRAVTVGYLQTVRNLAPESIAESKHVLRSMLDAESVPRQSDGRGIQGRLAKVLSLDVAVFILLRRALSCAKEMGQHPAILHAIWRIFAPPDIACDFNFADDLTCAIMANDIDDEHGVHAQHTEALDAQQAIHARRVADGVIARTRATYEAFVLLAMRRTGPFDPPPPPGGEAAAAGAATATATQAAPANAATAEPPRKPTSAERREMMRLKIAAQRTSPGLPQNRPPQAAAAAAAAPDVPGAQGQASTGTMSDVLFLAHTIGCPLAVLTIDPDARQAVVVVNVYPNGVAPYDDTRPPAPGSADEYVPMSADDPDHDPRHHASDTSSLAWLTRFVDKHPGYMIVATRRTAAGRIMFASITRTARPEPVEPPDPFLSPATAGAAGGTREGGASRASEHTPEHTGHAGADATAARALALIPPPPPPVPPGGRPTRPPDARVGTAAGGSGGASRAGPQPPQGPPPHAPTGGTIAPTAAAQAGASPITVRGGDHTTTSPGAPTPREPGLAGDTSTDAGAASADGGEHADMMGGLGTPAAAGTHPITVRTNDRVDAAAGHGGTPSAHPAAAAPHDDDGSDMEDDVAAPPSASARSDASSPVDDDTGPAPEREVEGAAPAGEAICGDGSDDVDMGRDDNPDPPSAPPGDTGPLASHEEDDGGLAADERSSAEDSHGDSVMLDAMEQDDGRVVAVAGQPEPGDPPLHVSTGDERADADMEPGGGNTSLEADPITMGVGAAAEGGAPPSTPRPGSGLERAFAKAALLARLTTQDDYVAENTLREVYRVTMSLVQPGGLMAGLLIDKSVGYSVVIPQAVAALENVEGLMAAVHAADADDLLALFVKAAIHDVLVPGVLGEHTAAGGTSSSAPSTH